MEYKNFNPKVSIIIPVYNGANYLSKAVDSALAQTYKNIEVIVVNDGSDDNGKTEKIAKSYGNKIQYFFKENGGVATALNLGIKMMTGEYFSWLSHDDMYKKEKIEHQINSIKKLKNKNLILAEGYDVIDKNDDLLYKVKPLQNFKKEQLEIGLFSLMRGCINGCCLLIPKKFFSEAGVFNEKLLTTQDYDLFYRLFKKYNLSFLNYNDVLSRAHSNQGSKKILNFHIEECNILWKSMIESLSEEEMIYIDGSVYDFLFNTRKFLKENTLYLDTIEYLDLKLVDIILKEIQLNNIDAYSKLEKFLSAENLSKYEIHKIINLIKKENNNDICFLLGDVNQKGGLNRVVIKIANILSKSYKITLISTTTNINGYNINNNVKHLLLNPKICQDSKLFSKIMRLLNVKLLINSYNCLNEYLLLYKDLKKQGIKTIAWNHEFYYLPYSKKELISCIKNRIDSLNYADVVIWINKYSYQLYSVFVNNGIYLPNPIIFEKSIIINTKNNKKNLIAIGRFDDEGKGLTELLKVFSFICKKDNSIILRLVGSIDLDKKVSRISDDITYREYIKLLRIPKNNLKILGEIDNVEDFYKMSDLHIMTAYNEGFGLVILEAAEYGIPSVVFNGSGADDIITNNKNGFLIEYGECKLMADKIYDVLNMNDDEFLNLRENTLQLSKKYSINNIETKWIQLIDKILLNDTVQKEKLIDLGFCPKLSYDYNFIKKTCISYEDNIKKIISFNENKIVTTKHNKFINLLYKTLIYYDNNGLMMTIKKIKNKFIH